MGVSPFQGAGLGSGPEVPGNYQLIYHRAVKFGHYTVGLISQARWPQCPSPPRGVVYTSCCFLWDFIPNCCLFPKPSWARGSPSLGSRGSGLCIWAKDTFPCGALCACQHLGAHTDCADWADSLLGEGTRLSDNKQNVFVS